MKLTMQMIRATNVIQVVTLLCLCCSILSCKQQPKPDDRLPVEVLAVPAGQNGWGYEVYVDHKIFIKQQYMPAVSGQHPFATKDQALLTANLVVKKMKQGKKPTLTLEDLKQLGVVANQQ